MTYLGLQRRFNPSAQVNTLGSGRVTLPSAKTAYDESSFESIFSFTIGSDTSVTEFTFSSIPQTYKHLELHIFARDTRAGNFDDQLRARYNGDTGLSYGYAQAYRMDTSAGLVTGSEGTNQSYSVITTSNQNNNFGYTQMTILDYTNTSKKKTAGGVHATIGATAGNFRVGITGGFWTGTAAITSISLRNEQAGYFLTGSRFDLYGYKGE